MLEINLNISMNIVNINCSQLPSSESFLFLGVSANVSAFRL